MKQYNKPRKSCALFGLGFLEMIPSPWLGFLRGVFLANHPVSEMTYTVSSGTLNPSIPYHTILANHLASNDNLTRTTKRQTHTTKTSDT